MFKKIKIAVIGCGKISEAHLYAYSLMNNVDLAAVVDVNEEAAKFQAKKFDTAYYMDWKEMLDKEKPDAVSICLPTFLHKEAVLETIKKGASILCEKPLAATYAEGHEMVVKARQNNLLLITGFCWRFHPPIIKIKKLISEGKLGKILMFRLRFGGYKNRAGQWASEKNKGGGVLMDESVHAIDLFRYLIGEIKNISARSATFLPEMKAEDTVILLLESDGGTIGVIEDTWATAGSKNSMEIYGEKGSVLTDLSRVTFNIDGNIESLELEEDDKNWLHSKRFKEEINHFIRCLRKEEKPVVTGEDGLKAIQVVEAARQSIKNKKWIEL